MQQESFRAFDSCDVQKEGSGEEEGEKEEEEKEEVLDLEAYKKKLEEKRQNLPNFVSKKVNKKKITTDEELEAQGYTLHVKEGKEEEEEEEDEEESGHGSDEEDDEPKKKTMNVFEYIHHGGGRVNLFPSRRRGRGGPGGRGGWRGGSGDGEYRGRGGRSRGVSLSSSSCSSPSKGLSALRLGVHLQPSLAYVCALPL